MFTNSALLNAIQSTETAESQLQQLNQLNLLLTTSIPTPPSTRSPVHAPIGTVELTALAILIEQTQDAEQLERLQGKLITLQEIIDDKVTMLLEPGVTQPEPNSDTIVADTDAEDDEDDDVHDLDDEDAEEDEHEWEEVDDDDDPSDSDLDDSDLDDLDAADEGDEDSSVE